MRTADPAAVRTVIVLARGQASFYEFLKPRQEATEGTVVILDRRGNGDATHPGGPAPSGDPGDRRAPTPEAALALMSVLGFMVLHRDGDRWRP